MSEQSKTIQLGPLLLGLAGLLSAGPALAHHSFAMYDTTEVRVMTGIVTRVDPNPNHLQVFFAPLNEARDQVLKDDAGEPIVWSVEMQGAAQAARDGITVNAFPRGTIVSVGVHPLRNGHTGGGRGESGFFRCPVDTPPAPGMHCDSVPGNEAFGSGTLDPEGANTGR